MKKIRYFHEKFDYLKRHFFTILPHLTIKKIINIILNEIEMRLTITTPKSLPLYIKIEPTPLCQLRCKGCAQSGPDFKKQLNNSMHLSLEKVKKIIDPICDTIIGVSLSLTGEPLLNEDIISIIEYISSKNIGVSFPTNFSVKLSNEKIERLVKSGLDSITISLDGASEETYTKFRTGGNFNLITNNVKLISDTKKKLGFKRPRIIWKFIIFDYNRHEIEIVKNTYKSLGFDSYEFVPNFYDDLSKNVNKTYKNNMIKNKKPCYWLWNSMIVRWNGKVSPCCAILDQFNLGNAIEEDIRKIWQSKEYKKLRDGFKKKDYGLNMHPACKKCIGLEEVF